MTAVSMISAWIVSRIISSMSLVPEVKISSNTLGVETLLMNWYASSGCVMNALYWMLNDIMIQAGYKILF